MPPSLPDGGAAAAKTPNTFAAMVDAGVAAHPRAAKAGKGGAADPLAAGESWLFGVQPTLTQSLTGSKKGAVAADDDAPATPASDDQADWWNVPVDALLNAQGAVPPPAWQLHGLHIPVPGDEEGEHAGDPSGLAAGIGSLIAADAGKAGKAAAVAVVSPHAAKAFLKNLQAAGETQPHEPGGDLAAAAMANAMQSAVDAGAHASHTAPHAAVHAAAKVAAPAAIVAPQTDVVAVATLATPAAALANQATHPAIESTIGTSSPAGGRTAPAIENAQASPTPAVQFAADMGTGAQADDQGGANDQRHPSSAATRLEAAVAASQPAATPAENPVFVVPGPAPAPAPAAAAVTQGADAQAASAPTIDPENVDRIVQSMQVSSKQGVMEATVHLRPDYLGDVTIQLKVDGTGVSAVVHAESSGVREWLESKEQTIRQGLSEHGLDLDKFVVDQDGQRQEQAWRDAETAEQQRQSFKRRRPSTGTTQRFEITV
jgi:flagellar hook-length control protein FliK